MAPGLTGAVIASRTLVRGDGAPVAAVVIRPDDSDANRATLRDTATAWRQLAGSLGATASTSAVHRVYFASDVAQIASGTLGDPDARLLAAQTADGRVLLGLAVYRFDPDGPRWCLGLLATSPVNVPGYPGALTRQQVRGIGTFLLLAFLDDTVVTGCTVVELEPLDAAAATFYRARGFSPTGHDHDLRLSCPDARVVAADLHATPLDADYWVATADRDDLARVNPQWMR